MSRFRGKNAVKYEEMSMTDNGRELAKAVRRGRTAKKSGKITRVHDIGRAYVEHVSDICQWDVIHVQA